MSPRASGWHIDLNSPSQEFRSNRIRELRALCERQKDLFRVTIKPPILRVVDNLSIPQLVNSGAIMIAKRDEKSNTNPLHGDWYCLPAQEREEC